MISDTGDLTSYHRMQSRNSTTELTITIVYIDAKFSHGNCAAN